MSCFISLWCNGWSDSCFPLMLFSTTHYDPATVVLWVLMLIQLFPLQALKLAASWVWNTSSQALKGLVRQATHFQVSTQILSPWRELTFSLISRKHLSPSLLPHCTPQFHSIYFFHRMYHSLRLSWLFIYLLFHCLCPLTRM